MEKYDHTLKLLSVLVFHYRGQIHITHIICSVKITAIFIEIKTGPSLLHVEK